MSGKSSTSYARPALLLIGLAIIGLLIAVLMRMPSRSNISPTKKMSDLMTEIEALESNVLELEDTISNQALKLLDKEKLLVDKYLELELMIRWVKRIESEGVVKADSIEMLIGRITSLRQRLIAQKGEGDAKKILNYDIIERENDSLKHLLDSFKMLQADQNRNIQSALLITKNYRFTNVRSNGKEETGIVFKRKSLRQINFCFDLPANPLAQAGEQVLYLVYENPDGTIRNAASNRTVYVEGEEFPYTNVALVKYEREGKQVCMPIIYNKAEAYQKGIQYIYIYHNDEAIGRTHFEIE